MRQLGSNKQNENVDSHSENHTIFEISNFQSNEHYHIIDCTHVACKAAFLIVYKKKLENVGNISFL